MSSSIWHKHIGEALEAGVFGRLSLLYRYGSKSNYSDVDFFAIYEDYSGSANVMLGSLDFWAIGKDEFLQMLSLLDPFVTEPILTGELLFKNGELWDMLKKQLDGIVPSEKSCTYLVKRSLDSLDYAMALQEMSEIENRSQSRKFWSALSFSVSYWMFASEYSYNWRDVLSLQDLVNKMSPNIKSYWERIHKAKMEHQKPDVSELYNWTKILLNVNQRGLSNNRMNTDNNG